MIDTVQKVSSLTSGVGISALEESTSLQMPNFAPTPGQATGMSFSEVLGNMASDAVDNIKQAEVKSFEGIKGEASTREVVDAVLAAEQSLQTALALRDKLVSAYLDITKMQI